MRAIIVLFVLCCLGWQSAEAQRRRVPPRGSPFGWGAGPVEFGVRGGHSFEEGVSSAGAQLRLPLVEGLVLAPSADVFLGDEALSEWQLNADLAVGPRELGGLFAGIGAAFVSHDPDADGENEVQTGYNLFAGLSGGPLLYSRVRPFAEARWTYLEDFSPFRLVAGINVPVR